jgi:hypothetical protein
MKHQMVSVTLILDIFVTDSESNKSLRISTTPYIVRGDLQWKLCITKQKVRRWGLALPNCPILFIL